MSTYTAPQHNSHKHRKISPRSIIIIAAFFLLPISLLAISKAPVSANAANNPFFATLQDVQNAINAALAPINSAITNLQKQQSTQAQRIASLQNSTDKQLKAYDANGNALGVVVGVGNNGATIYSPLLNEFLHIATNSYYENPNNNGGFFASGIGNVDQQLGTIYYQSNDCSGTPYASIAQGFTTNSVLPFSPTEFYTYHPSDTMTTITANSQRQDSNYPIACQPISSGYTAHVWPVYPVTLPFPTPIAEPVQFKYQ